MGLWNKLKDRAEKKKAELQKKAVERAADMALQKTRDTLDSMGKTIENAIFGPESEKAPGSEADDPPASEPPAARKPASASKHSHAKTKPEGEPPAKKEPLTRDYDRFVKDREQKARDLDKAVDDDLAALKKKLGKK